MFKKNATNLPSIPVVNNPSYKFTPTWAEDFKVELFLVLNINESYV